MSYRIERWIPPKRDKKTRRIIVPGKWFEWCKAESREDAESELRQLGKRGIIARATGIVCSGADGAGTVVGMRIRPDGFASWTGSGGAPDWSYLLR